MAYPPPVPVVKGKAARELLEDLDRSKPKSAKNPHWKGSKALYQKLRPKEE